MAIILGRGIGDDITGTDRKDIILGFGGDDIILAGGGNDLVLAGRGDDLVRGGDGDDRVFGGRGRDMLFGDGGRDYLFGGSGDDDLTGGSGGDFLSGGRGFDRALYDGSVFNVEIFSSRGLTGVKVLDDAGAVVETDHLIGVEALYFAAEDYTFYIDGRDNAVLFTGDDSGTVTEDTGVPAMGTLLATDFDGTDGIVAVLSATLSSNGYGRYTIDEDGNWTYTLDDSNATVDALNDGDTLSDSFEVLATDGTVQTVDITINGADDLPPGAILVSFDTPVSEWHISGPQAPAGYWESGLSGDFIHPGGEFNGIFAVFHYDLFEENVVQFPFHDANGDGDLEYGLNTGINNLTQPDLGSIEFVRASEYPYFDLFSLDIGGGEDGGFGKLNFYGYSDVGNNSSFIWNTEERSWSGRVGTDGFSNLTTDQMVAELEPMNDIFFTLEGDVWIDDLVFINRDDVPPADAITLDFQSGEISRSSSYTYSEAVQGWHSTVYGTVEKGGFRADYESIHDVFNRDDESVAQNPIHDADGDGDPEYGLNNGISGFQQRDVALMWITEDGGGDFKLFSMDVGGGEDNGSGEIHLEARGSSFDWSTQSRSWSNPDHSDLTTEEMVALLPEADQFTFYFHGDVWIDDLILA